MSARPQMIFTVTNPRHIVLVSAVVLAKAMHTGPRCAPCRGQGLLYNGTGSNYSPCHHCDGFGRRLRST